MWNLETIRRGKLSNDGEVAGLWPGKSCLERMPQDVDLFTADCSKKTVGYGTEGKKHSHPTHTGICGVPGGMRQGLSLPHLARTSRRPWEGVVAPASSSQAESAARPGAAGGEGASRGWA